MADFKEKCPHCGGMILWVQGFDDEGHRSYIAYDCEPNTFRPTPTVIHVCR